jgi:mono/diheme cytochrome c family protein
MKTATGLIFFFGAIVCAQQSASVWDGVYLGEQATRGKAIFGEHCAACHNAELTGRNGPALKGETFTTNWNGLPVGDLFDYINKSMPRGQSFRLNREDTAAVVALILTSNGFPAGKKDLPTDAAALQAIRFEAAKPTLETSKP